MNDRADMPLPETPLNALLERMASELEAGLVPVEIFADARIFETELERIFARSWVFLGFESEIPNAGDFMQRRIGRDSVIVTRDGKGAIHVLANFCRHRGTKLCQTDAGNASHFRCAYHGWVFKNNGDWIGAPDKSRAYGGLNARDWGLLRAPHVESFLGLIFASLDADAPPLAAHLGEAGWMLRGLMDLAPGGMKVMGPPDRYRVHADWKTGAENFSGDMYHVGAAHGSIQSIGFADFSQLNGSGTHYVFNNGHGFVGQDAPPPLGEAGQLWFYSQAIKDRLDLSRIDETLRAIITSRPPTVGTIFPNLSWLRFIGPGQAGGPSTYTSWRQWQPIGPGEMELWSWQLKWDFMTDEEAAESYAAGQYSFGSAGIFEQDDTVVWEGAPEVARSVWARKNKTSFNMQMGMPGIGEQAPDPSWTGPGKAFRPGLGEPTHRNFYGEWLRQMREAGR